MSVPAESRGDDQNVDSAATAAVVVNWNGEGAGTLNQGIDVFRNDTD